VVPMDLARAVVVLGPEALEPLVRVVALRVFPGPEALELSVLVVGPLAGSLGPGDAHHVVVPARLYLS
jgi:hypothetical protein